MYTPKVKYLNKVRILLSVLKALVSVAATAATTTEATMNSMIQAFAPPPDLARLSIFLQSMECGGPPGGSSGLADGTLPRCNWVRAPGFVGLHGFFVRSCARFGAWGCDLRR